MFKRPYNQSVASKTTVDHIYFQCMAKRHFKIFFYVQVWSNVRMGINNNSSFTNFPLRETWERQAFGEKGGS